MLESVHQGTLAVVGSLGLPGGASGPGGETVHNRPQLAWRRLTRGNS